MSTLSTGTNFNNDAKNGYVTADGFSGPNGSAATFPNGATLSSGTVSGNLNVTGSGTISGALIVKSGGTVSGGLTVTGGSTVNGAAVIGQMTPVQVSATSAAVGPAIPLGIPAGATVEQLLVDTVTAFTGATVSACIGSASGDASYVADISVKNGGRVVLLPTTAAGSAAFLSVPAGSGLVLTISQGTPTAVGSATVQGTITV